MPGSPPTGQPPLSAGALLALTLSLPLAASAVEVQSYGVVLPPERGQPPEMIVGEDSLPAGVSAPVLATRYGGTLPCADCAGIRTELTLFSDPATGAPRAYRMRETYLGTRGGDRAHDSAGAWALLRGTEAIPDATVYQLNPGQPAEVRSFVVLPAGSLRQLDREGRPIRSALSYALEPRDPTRLVLRPETVIDLPATFVGDLPCPDCPAPGATVTLRPDRTFLLRRTPGQASGDRVDTVAERGLWTVGDEGRLLVLEGTAGPRIRLAVEGPQTLRLAEAEPGQAGPSAGHVLVRAAAPESLPGAARMQGLFSYLADAGLFFDCLTGRRYPVAQEGDNAALESAYIDARPEPGAQVLVTLESRLERRARVDGAGEEEALVVTRFEKTWPGSDCGPTPPAALENTYWKVVEVAGQPVAPPGGEQEAHLVLVPGEKRVRGFTGCNRFMGGYEGSDGRLRFGALASTRRACDDGGTEQAILQALESADGYRIKGDTLELTRAGTTVARFQAVYLR
jgi:copper homeostasis protein (lipoprotein)